MNVWNNKAFSQIAKTYFLIIPVIIQTSWFLWVVTPPDARIQDFSEVGSPTLQGRYQHTILPNFPKNCMKLKKILTPGRVSRAPFDPSMASNDLRILSEI